MKKWTVITAAVVFVTAGFAFAAQRAWGPGGHGFHRREGRGISQRILTLLDNPRFQAEVKLTDDQVSHLRQIVINAEKSNIETRSKIAVAGIDLRQMLMANKVDQNAVMEKVQQISELRGQMMKDNVQALLEAKTVLTPEQQEKIRQFIQRRFRERGWGRNRMEHHRGGMMRPGTPPSPPTPPAPPSQ